MIKIILFLWFATALLPLQGDEDQHEFHQLDVVKSEWRQRPNGTSSWTSTNLQTRTPWSELIVSWNSDLPSTNSMRIEVQPPRVGWTNAPWYCLGIWSPGPLRSSVGNQKNEEAEVQTDLLKLRVPATNVQVRLVVDGPIPTVRFLGLCFTGRGEGPRADEVIQVGVINLPVPERSQLTYPEGGAWCSPTSTSMVLAYWAQYLKRPDLDKSVPETAAGVHDPSWGGTGNWPFNTAYAGSLPGIRAYVTRFHSLRDLESLLARKVPVICSVDSTILNGREGEESGHLVVCRGLTKDGQIIINDPGTRHQIQKTIIRSTFEKAWARSQNTVYLIYPETHDLPAGRLPMARPFP